MPEDDVPEDDEPAWTVEGRRPLITTPWANFVEHDVRLSDGSSLSYLVDEGPPFAVATLVVLGDRVLLSRQYRHPLGRWIFDLPGGAGRVGEKPIEAASRELEEELGVIPRDLAPLLTFSTNPGRQAWLVHLFSATATDSGHADRSDPAEQVRLVSMPLSELDEQIARGDIVDATLLVARAIAGLRGVLPPLARA